MSRRSCQSLHASTRFVSPIYVAGSAATAITDIRDERLNAFLYARVQALRNALDDEVHGLWISDDMAVKILTRLDATTANPLKCASGNDHDNAKSSIIG